LGDPNLSSFIWSVADLLRGDYKQSEYGKVILPFTVLRRRTLQQQPANNTKEQFGSSPTLATGITDAIMDAMDAHSTMSRQALNSVEIRDGIKQILLNYAGLWEALRARAAGTEQTQG
jgi:type I restriction enzyme R subunit